MSFQIATTPYTIRRNRNLRGRGIIFIGMGERYDIEITVCTPHPGPSKKDREDHIYEDEGELVIRDGNFTLPKGKSRAREMLKFLFDRSTNMAQTACFGATKAVSATPDNIVKAIQWCQANPNFMQDEQGI